MNNLKENLKMARSLIENASILSSMTNYEMFNRLYPFTNENIKDCFNYLDIENKDCLTVLGSGDQALDLCLKGAKSLTAFDKNPLTEYYYDLKIAALKANLLFEDFLKFFINRSLNNLSRNNKQAFNYKTFEKISKYLFNNSYIFWTTLFNNYRPEDIRNSLGMFYHSDEFHVNTLMKTINYLNPTDYEILKNKIKNIDFNFINCNITDLSKLLKEKYDLVYLSNIMQYYDQIFPHENKLDSMQNFKQLIDELKNKLNINGLIAISYLYAIENEKEEYKIIREHIFKGNNYNYNQFKAIEDYEIQENFDIPLYRHDACLIYKKKSLM